MNSIRLLLAIITLPIAASSLVAEVIPARLRCEYRENPLAVDSRAPRLSWILQASERGQIQSAYRLQAATSAAVLATGTPDLWDSGKVSSRHTINISYEGKPLSSGMIVHWRVRSWDHHGKASAWSKPAFFRMGILDISSWQAQWIGVRSPDPKAPQPSPHLRKTFKLTAPIKRAIAHASALGLYELRLNGSRIGNQVLAPEWTDYHERVQYQAYDVTDKLKQGENVIGAILGNGWYAGRIGISWIVPDGPPRGIYGPRPLFLLELHLELATGDRRIIPTDGTWRATTAGPIRAADLLDGETQDARLAMPGWDTATHDDSDWQPVDVAGNITSRLVAQPNEPMTIVEERQAITLTEPRPGYHVFDFGQNMVGWCRLRARGNAGMKVTLRHAEILKPDGTIYTKNLRSAAQIDRFIFRGAIEEVFEPHFTYHGFRYVEVSGLSSKPTLDTLTACVIHSNATLTGRFECSNPLLTKLMKNILWTQRGNMHSTPTDCPQRDERMGWLGDAQVFSQTACFNMDMAAFFTKWLRDVRDDQAKDGRFPDFAPHPFDSEARFSGAPAWADAGVIVPWRVYINYGDRRILEESYDAAKRWVEFVRSQSPGLLWTGKRGNDYNDWLNGNTLILEGWPKKGGEIPREIFATAFFAHSTTLVAKMATALGRQQEAESFRALARDIRRAFNRAFLNDTGRLRGDTQAGYALALHFDLLPEDQRASAVKHMVEGIKKYDGHLSTGIQSTSRLLLELNRHGLEDIAYRVVLDRRVPSWCAQIDQGATTIWERWDGYVKSRGFQNPDMNSFNHYALGAVGEWVYRTALGINPDEKHPGYDQFIIRPRPGGKLTWARGSYDSIRGRIASSWRSADQKFTLEVTIPANTTARVHLPTTRGALITESGRAITETDGTMILERGEHTAICEVKSGTYHFVVEKR